MFWYEKATQPSPDEPNTKPTPIVEVGVDYRLSRGLLTFLSSSVVTCV